MLFILCPSSAGLTLNLIYFPSPTQDWWWFFAKSCGVGSFLDVLVNHILAPQGLVSSVVFNSLLQSTVYTHTYLTVLSFMSMTHGNECSCTFLQDLKYVYVLTFTCGCREDQCMARLWSASLCTSRALNVWVHMHASVRDRICLWSHLSLRLDSYHITVAVWNLGIWYEQVT